MNSGPSDISRSRSTSVLNSSQIQDFAEAQRTARKTVGLCHGTFDLVHPGHLAHFEACRRLCDVLVVTITADLFIRKGPGRPLFNQLTRAHFLAGLRPVDAVFIVHESTAMEAIRLVRPDFYFKGVDYKDESADLTGMIRHERELVESLGGKLVVTETVKHSSTDLMRLSGLLELPEPILKFMETIRQRTSYDEVLSIVEERFSKLAVCVVGDLIIDEYVTCTPVGTTSKAPAISAVFSGSERMLGGSAAIARHLAEYASTVDLVCQKGDRNWAFDEVFSLGMPEKVGIHFLTNAGGYTPHKIRFNGHGYPNSLILGSDSPTATTAPSKLFEYAYLNGDGRDSRSLLKRLESEPDFLSDQAVVLADFGHGLISKAAYTMLRTRSSFVALNVQTNSTNFGFNLANRYQGADLVCIDELEGRLLLQDRRSDLENVLPGLLALLECRELVITQGSKGMQLATPLGDRYSIPAMATRIVDPVGAGDAVLSLVTLATLAEAPRYVSALLGACAGAIACGIVGNREPVRKSVLLKYIAGLF